MASQSSALAPYFLEWSDDDHEYAGRHEQFPSLSWLAPDPREALQGIQRLVEEIHDEQHEA